MGQSQLSVQRHREIALREHDYDVCGNGCILVRDEVRRYHQTRLLFFFYHPVINILGLTCSLVCNKRKLATPTAVEIFHMEMQVGN